MEQYYGAAAELRKRNKRGIQVNLKAILILLGILVLIGLLVAGVYFISNDGTTASFPRLVARQQKLQELTALSSKRIKNVTLSAVNAEASVLFLGEATAYKAYLESKYGMKNVPKEIAAPEANDESLKKIDEGFLLNNYDITYVGVLRDRMAATLQLTKAIHADADKTLRELLDVGISNLESIDAKLSNLKL